MGTSIAMYAAQRTDPLEEPVVLFERGALADGSSGRSGAILRQYYADAPVAAMARDSLRAYATFELRTGRPAGFRRTGVLTLTGPGQPDQQARMRKNVAMLQGMGVKIELIDVARIREVCRGAEVADGTVGAWEPEGGFVDPVRAVEAFGSLARQRGAATRLGVTVQELVIEENKVVGLKTSEGDYEVKAVALVAGPWSGKLLAAAGVEVPLRILRPENHFLALPDALIDREAETEEDGAGGDVTMEDPLEVIAEELAHGQVAADPLALHPVLIDLEHGFYCRCEPRDDRTRVGRTDYSGDLVLEDPDTLSEEVGAEMRSFAREALSTRMPAYRGRPDAGSRAGWYTLTPDARPVIGPVASSRGGDPIEGLVIATGFSGHGFKLAPSVGEGVTQMLFGEPVSAFDARAFAPDRFDVDPDWTGAYGL